MWAANPLPAQDAAPRYVEWLGYLGGGGDDIGYGVGTDLAGNVYVAGSTSSFDLGAAAGWPEEIQIEGSTDAFVAKLSPDGGEILALTTLGGPGADAALALRVAPDGGVIVGGNAANGFPADLDCDHAVAGSRDVFVARFSPELELEALQLLGGSGDEGLRDLHVAPDGTIAVTGYTSSRDLLDGWVGIAFQPTFKGGNNDFFVVRLRLAASVDCGERVLYQSYLGSAGDEADPEGAPFPGVVRAGADGLLTIAGTTTSWSTFVPRLAGGFLAPNRGGENDTFVVQLRGDASLPAAEQLIYTAILGGSSFDLPNWVELDGAGRIVVAGQTASANYPVTDGSFFSGWNDNFVAVLDPSPSAAAPLLSSGLAGGEQWDLPTDALWRADGNIVLGGSTGSSGFPRTPDALGAFSGNEIPQAFLYQWRPEEGLPRAKRITFASPLTTASDCFDRLRCNRVIALAGSPGGSIIACGVVSGSLLAAAGAPAQPEKSSGADVLIGSFDLRCPTASIALDKTSGEAPLEVHGTATVTTPEPTKIESASWTITGPGGTVEYQGLELQHTFAAKGNYRVTFTVKNDRDRIATRSQIVRVQAPTAPRFVRADVDGSNDIDISDAVAVLVYLFLGTATPACLDAADGDDSGGIELTDAIHILGFLFLGGPAPLPPYPECGVDGSLVPDELGCLATSPGCR